MMFLFVHLGNILPSVCLLVKSSAQLIISKHISISSQSSERVKVTQRKLFLFILLLKEDEIDAGNMKMNKHFTAIANCLSYEYIIRILQYKKHLIISTHHNYLFAAIKLSPVIFWN